MSATSRSTGSTRLPAYLAFWCGLLFALPNLYWAMGGTLALDTIGGVLERAVRSREPVMVLVLYATVLVKAAGAMFALALVQSWGRVFPRSLLLAAGWLATAVLVLYGGILVGVQALVATRVIPAPPGIDWTAVLGHLFIWDMWFLVWGILLGAAMWVFTRAGRDRT